TGSIGQSTLKILDRHPDEDTLFAVTAYSRIKELAQICKQYQPKIAVVPESKVDELRAVLLALGVFVIEILAGEQGLITVAESSQVDIV
ncbi:1-deoxy-D-xylulose-5-phosphate reductoisomerase, partial [Acinetobacter ursingii]